MSRAGFSLVELLVALALGLILSVAAVATAATALRHVAAFALRAEADDLAYLALETFTLDVRRAGFDPRATGFDPLAVATTSRLTVQADLDGDGAVDGASEEVTTIACDVPGGRLSRVVGGQSLPLANGVVACTLAYADAGGAPLSVPAGGLDAASRRRVRSASLDVALVPPGAGAAATSRTTVALRVRP
jgi:prepilin-type N-terminal cleavage/methylation domain-containing protein